MGEKEVNTGIIERCKYILTLNPDSNDFIESVERMYMLCGIRIGINADELRNLEELARSRREDRGCVL